MTQLFDSIRAAIIAAEGDTEATCHLANRLVFEAFAAGELGGSELVRVQGTYEGQDHEWAELDGVTLDLTADQFGGEPVVFAAAAPAQYSGRPSEWCDYFGHDATRLAAIRAHLGAA